MAVPTIAELVEGHTAEGNLGALQHLREIHQAWYNRPGCDLNIGIETVLKGIATERLALIDAAISSVKKRPDK